MKTKTNLNWSAVVLYGTYVLLVITCIATQTSAQNSKQAKADYDKAVKLVEKADYTKAHELYLSAIEHEISQDKPDHHFLAETFQYLALWYSNSQMFHKAHKYYTYAAIQYHQALEFTKTKNSLYNAGVLSDSIHLYNEARPDKDELGAYVSFDFSVKSVTTVVEDTTWFILNAGSNQGISFDQRGWILTGYKSGTERGNQVFGRCGVSTVYNTYSVAWAIRSQEAKTLGLELLPEDNVQLNVNLPNSTYTGLLLDLAKLNIYFTDDYKVPLYSMEQLKMLTKRQSEEAFITAMQEIIRGTAEYLYDGSEASKEEYPPLVSGMFAGLNMWEAMLQCTNRDVRAFLRFVVSFPAKYMGHPYRIDETFATWVINYTPLGSEEQDNLTKEFIALSESGNRTENALWIDDNFRLIQSDGLDFKKVTDHIYHLISDSSYALANDRIDAMIDLTKRLKQDSLLHVYMNTRGQAFSAQKQYDNAIDVFKEVLMLDSSNANAHWFLGHAYLSNDEFKRALEEYDYIKNFFADWAGGHAMYGWTLIKSGRFPQALEYCKKGYDLDSFDASYIMNLGHAYLLTNEPGEARYYYDRAIASIKNVATFDQGLMEDFSIFLKNFWQTDLVRKERDYLINEWENHYKNKVLANEYFEKGKKLEENEKYADAGVAFDKAIEYEQKGEAVRYDWLRSYHRWAAYEYYKTKDYTTSLKRYKSGWEVNRNYLNDLEAEIKDLEAIGNLYSWLNNDLQKDMYRKMQQAAQRKLQTQSRSNNLYVISIGRNTHGNFGYAHAESDARAIAEAIKERGKLIFDQSQIQVFANPNRLKVQEAFEKVISASRPGDCFVFYYSGYCSKYGVGEMILGKDTIRNDQLLGWLKLMQADKKVILMDAANHTLITEFVSKQEETDVVNGHENITFILSDGRIELPNDSSGLFTSFIIKGLRGEAAADWGTTYQLETSKGMKSMSYVSAKGLEGYMYGKMNKGNMQFELKSYSQGADFPLSFTANRTVIGADTLPPMIFVNGSISSEGTRGAIVKTVNVKERLFGQALDASGIDQITVNGEKVPFTQNGKFELEESAIKNWTKIIVTAQDKNGKEGSDSFFLVKGGQELTSKDRDPGSQNIVGTNYAILFATNTYDNWSDLKNPINDARKIGEILEQEYGFQVKIFEDLTREEIRKVLFEYYGKPYTSKDQLFVFFAGHGMHHTAAGGLIVCKDSKKVSDDPTFDSYLEFSSIKTALNNVYKCQHIMLTLDVCYGGAGFNDKNALYYGNSTADIKSDPTAFFEQRLKYKTRLYLTSGDSTYVSDGSGEHSPFAIKFINTLKSQGVEKGGIITLTDFASNMRFTESGRQEIRYGSFGDSHIEGDFVFMYKGNGLKQNSDNLTQR